MKGFHRENLLLSLCGLHCGLCPMHLDGHCPGCGGGEGNQSCKIARCSMQQGGIEYCYQCTQYPCVTLLEMEKRDSFITHQNQCRNLERLREIGVVAYKKEQEKKAEILRFLLSECNDGRKKNYYRIAVNLLPLPLLTHTIDRITSSQIWEHWSVHEKSLHMSKILEELAHDQCVILKLQRKTDPFLRAKG